MSTHLTKVLCAALIVLAAACKSEPADPFDKAAIERDLEERPLKALYEEFEKISWTPPLHGTLSDAQIQSYIEVTRLSDRIIEVTSGQLDEKIEKASRDDDRYSRMATAFSAIGNARNAATAQIRAALTLHVNPHEYNWVSQQIARAAGEAVRKRNYLAHVDAAQRALDAESNPYLRERRESDLATARLTLLHWADSLGDAERANAETVLKHDLALRPYVRGLQERTSW
ncbi:MAG TPA: hypothetical protein VF787_05425 [Thermoanaerobaculia bacterium]